MPATVNPQRRILHRLALLIGLGLGACHTPAPVSPTATERRVPLELRQLVTQLEWTMDSAERGGLFELKGDVNAGVERQAELQRFLASFHDTARGIDALARALDRRDGEEAFLLNYTAELAIYLNLAQLMDHTVGHSPYETIFSEVRPELGLQAGAWTELKNAFNLQPWNKPLALLQLRHEALLDEYQALGIDQRAGWAIQYIADHKAELWRYGVNTGPQVFAKDVLQRATDGLQWIWFPAQKEVAETLGDTRVVPAARRLISDAQIRRATVLLRPGDVVVERRNWYLSNIGLPGFWPHTALYVGNEAQVAAEFGKEFVVGLEQSAPEAVRAWRQLDAAGHPLRILEAISEGVVFSSTEHSLGADYVAALRPTLDRAERGSLLSAAFEYFGRPYDFDFDFRTDDSIVCSELVYKAYGAALPEGGVKLPLESILGRPVLSPNRLVAHYAEHSGDALPPFTFVFFLDGVESEGKAYFRDAATLSSSHLRSKWDIAQR